MEENEKKPARKAWRILLALFILLLIFGVAGSYWYVYMRGTVFSDDARIDGDLVDISPQVSGILNKIHVKEGDLVKAGQLLFSLDTKLLATSLAKAQASVLSAKAGLSATQAMYRKSKKGPRSSEIKIAVAVVKRAQTAYKFANSEWIRVKALSDSHMTRSNKDKVRAAWEAAGQAVEEVKSRLALMKEGVRSEDIDAARANVDLRKSQLLVAESTLKLAQVNLDNTKGYAPFDGVVVRTWQNQGVVITAGRPVLTILNPDTLSIAANIEEKYLSLVEIGDPVEISIDAYPKLMVKGRVKMILRATNSKFSLIPAEGVSGAYIKVAQRIPIKISVDSWPEVDLGPGLSVEVRIRVDDGQPLSIFSAFKKRP